IVQPEPFTDGVTAVERDSIINVNPENSRMFKFDPGVTLDDLVRTVNAVGAAPGDLMAILEALKEAGAIHGELVVI
ncbi:flagellar basal body P-ring protein FlgI, partial [Arsukibacterium sp.]|uniref:flagellar basal body P-ring protein FlgI n=1 Tax=Arsukibacterium sp. TaxID=1977258 RepID=UPI002FDA3A1F